MFKIGDKAVYPAHGVGVVSAIEDRNISGSHQTCYILKIFDKEMTIMIPQQNVKNVGLRSVIKEDQVNEVYKILKKRPSSPNPQSWNRRHREYMEKIKTGSLFEIAEVLRDLYLLKLEKDLSFGERKVFDTAKDLLVKELSCAREEGEDAIEAELKKLMNLKKR
jgi:CarD family transcriptional regulator